MTNSFLPSLWAKELSKQTKERIKAHKEIFIYKKEWKRNYVMVPYIATEKHYSYDGEYEGILFYKDYKKVYVPGKHVEKVPYLRKRTGGVLKIKRFT